MLPRRSSCYSQPGAWPRKVIGPSVRSEAWFEMLEPGPLYCTRHQTMASSQSGRPDLKLASYTVRRSRCECLSMRADDICNCAAVLILGAIVRP
ncbi:uncharacterized protein K452DRAFT_26494 [Aplosporella prunicola CBS 121167]|uniref:Uncharacterized protein n=1 Tax=Aplosporella prunicola CBS 121167 TaxID=1176127 RepID=A0A6A6BFE0_9PEZI|nr:uncharacterized protein K452DRAFT_26494 [Aplosporella prunicola CBS 121167]KAF2142093.1 hypothetical protein K452DRAFT_26494 [Aplosporella prunicola CBS 121167]